MREKPSWFRGTIEGKKEAAEPEEVLNESDPMVQLQIAQQFIFDSAPQGWESEIDNELLNEYRQDIIKMSDKELLALVKNNDVWSEPTYAKALLDVIGGKITPVL